MSTCPPWLASRANDDGSAPRWLRKCSKPGHATCEPTGATIETMARAIAGVDRSWATGAHSVGMRLLARGLERAGIRPPRIPSSLWAEGRATVLCDSELTNAFKRWAKRVAGQPWTLRVILAAWRKYRPQDVAKRRTVAKGRKGGADDAKGEA